MIPESEIIKFGKYKNTAYHIIQKKDPKYATWLESVWIPKDQYHAHMEKQKQEEESYVKYLKRKREKEKEIKEIKKTKPVSQQLEHYIFTNEYLMIPFTATKKIYVIGYSNNGVAHAVATETYNYQPVSGIYLLESEGLYKIGKSTDVTKRFKSHKTSNPLVKFIGFIHTQSLALETELHFKFKEFEYTKEWFHKNDTILQFFKAHKDYFHNPNPDNPSRILDLNIKTKVKKEKQVLHSQRIYSMYKDYFDDLVSKETDYIDTPTVEQCFSKHIKDAFEYENGNVSI